MSQNKSPVSQADEGIAAGPELNDPAARPEQRPRKTFIVAQRKAAAAAHWSRADLPRVLSVKAVAAGLDLSEKTVRRWIDNGSLPHHRVGRQIRIADYDLRAFLALGRHG